jgi:hypothetical protein
MSQKSTKIFISFSTVTVFKHLNIKHDYVIFEIFIAVTMKNGVFWDATPCGSCKTRRFGGT